MCNKNTREESKNNYKVGNCNHNHTHSGEKIEILSFFIGLVSFAVGYFLKNDNEVMSSILFITTVIISGYHIIFEGIKETVLESKIAKNFRPNVHFLMSIAALGAIAIGSYEEAAMLIIIFAGAHFLEEYIDEKSKKEITSLLKLNPTFARVILENGDIKKISVEEVKVGDSLLVSNGDKVPIDGVILKGRTSIDESTINGESIPKDKKEGDEVFASTINVEGSFTMEATREIGDTLFSKILEVVTTAQSNLTKTASFVKKIEPMYVSLVLVLFPVVILSGKYVFLWDWSTTLYRSMVYLISVSPCALAASAIPVTLATISNLSKRGVLVKGGAYLSSLSEVELVAFDKTGTLTTGRAIVVDYYFDKNEKNLYDIIVAMEKEVNHPLARSIVEKFDNKEQLEVIVANRIGVGLFGNYQGDEYLIAKPMMFKNIPDDILIKKENLEKEGKTVVLISKNNVVVGYIAFLDTPVVEAKESIEYFKNQGIHTLLLTGDARLTAEKIGRSVGIDEVVSNVLPSEKGRVIKEKKEKYGKVMMVGDGVNDAEALVLADVGVAMGEGSGVALESSDVVLMKNSLANLVYAHKLSKKMKKIAYQNLIFAMFVVVSLVVLNFLGKMDITFGVILHEGSTLVVILNALRMLRKI